MQKINSESEQLFIWTNPDFNVALIFYGLEAISFRDRKKSKELSYNLKNQLTKIRVENWPYKTPILIAIEINGPYKKFHRKDVDNMSKVILDACNKIIYNDDRLIHILIVQKRIWQEPLYGFHLGVRVLEKDKRDKYSPEVCFASMIEPDIDESKIKQPIIFHFENNADQEYIKQQCN